MIRLADPGIRLVGQQEREAPGASASSVWQKPGNAQTSRALPTLVAGIDQTVMMSLAMAVVAPVACVGGLGNDVLQAIDTQFLTAGFLTGFALVAIAIILDRTSRASGRRLQKHSEVIHG
ncbi:hypothetical protein [Shinella sp.]|uniref:hypothetical protein n=1 Tax=Shinella sp. TaxID=1870904 RepID=UPI00301E1A0A